MDPANVSKEVRDLVASACDGTIDAQQQQQLDDLIASDREVARYYARMFEMQAELYFLASMHRAREEALDSTATPSDSAVTLRQTKSPCDAKDKSLTLKVYCFFAQPTPLSMTVAALVIGVMLTIMAFTVPPFYRHLTRDNEDAAPMEFVAQLTGTHEAVWADGQIGTFVGSHLQASHRYKLESGLVEITYRNGAQVVIEGPAEYEVLGKSAGRLERGRLTARVAVESAKGFAVQAPHATVVDRGTEFGIETERENGTTVVVYEGRVDLQRPGAARAAVIASLEKGEQASVSRDGTISSRSSLNHRPLVRIVDFTQLRQEARAVRQTERNKDDSVVAIWRFDDPQELGRDDTGNSPALLVVGDAHYVADGWDGGALALDGDGDMLIANGAIRGLPSGDAPYTIAAWIKPSRSGRQGIIGWGAYGSDGRVNALRLNGENGVLLYWWSNDLEVTDQKVASAGVNMTGGRWIHIAATWDGTTRTIYLNGNQIARDQPISPDVADEHFAIGRTAPELNEFFAGQIDEVMIFDSALSEHRIRQLLQKPKP